MRHDLRLRGFGFELRPVEPSDAEFIVTLRQSRNDNGFLNRGADTIDVQREWLDKYFDRVGDYYFVVEDVRNGKAEGLVGLYHVDAAARIAEWGRWVLRHGSLAAPESALLIYRCAFERLTLESVYCRTLAENRQVLSFHDSTGLARNGEPVLSLINNQRRLVIEHRLERVSWPGIEARLSRIGSRLAAREAPIER